MTVYRSRPQTDFKVEIVFCLKVLFSTEGNGDMTRYGEFLLQTNMCYDIKGFL